MKRGGDKDTDSDAEPAANDRLTMADLARLAGVSAITVSRALGNSTLVNSKTRARVRELARQHGYALNVTARNLRLRCSTSVIHAVAMHSQYVHIDVLRNP